MLEESVIANERETDKPNSVSSSGFRRAKFNTPNTDERSERERKSSRKRARFSASRKKKKYVFIDIDI